jgi:hypothetical protein
LRQFGRRRTLVALVLNILVAFGGLAIAKAAARSAGRHHGHARARGRFGAVYVTIALSD